MDGAVADRMHGYSFHPTLAFGHLVVPLRARAERAAAKRAELPGYSPLGLGHNFHKRLLPLYASGHAKE